MTDHQSRLSFSGIQIRVSRQMLPNCKSLFWKPGCHDESLLKTCLCRGPRTPPPGDARSPAKTLSSLSLLTQPSKTLVINGEADQTPAYDNSVNNEFYSTLPRHFSQLCILFEHLACTYCQLSRPGFKFRLSLTTPISSPLADDTMGAAAPDNLHTEWSFWSVNRMTLGFFISLSCPPGIHCLLLSSEYFCHRCVRFE